MGKIEASVLLKLINGNEKVTPSLLLKETGIKRSGCMFRLINKSINKTDALLCGGTINIYYKDPTYIFKDTKKPIPHILGYEFYQIYSQN